MKTYGLTKDYRIKLYIIVFLISLVVYFVLDYYCLSKIIVPALYYFLVRMLLSLVSFSSINALFLCGINYIYTRKNCFNGKYNIVLESSYKDTKIDCELFVKVGLQFAKITLKSGTSFSQSDTIFIDNSEKERKIITYTYHNEGNCLGNNKLSMHNGTCLLYFTNGKFEYGKFYNDENRKTYGKLVLKESTNEPNNKG